MHYSRRPGRIALAIASAIAITGLGGSGAWAFNVGLNAPDLKASSDTGVDSTDNITKAASLTFTVTNAAPGDLVELWRGTTKVATGTASATGALELSDAPAASSVPEGTYDYTLKRGAEESPATSVTVDVTAPTDTPTLAPDLDAASDSGASSSDDITNDTSPTFNLSEALPDGIAQVELVRGGSGLAVPAFGPVATDLTTPADGVQQYATRFLDAAGNGGPAGPALPVTIRTQAASLLLNSPFLPSDTGRSSTDRYTTGLNLALGAALGLPAGVYGEVVNLTGAPAGASLVWTRLDPLGVTTPVAGTATAPASGAGSVTDILSLFVGQTPPNGTYTYAVTQSIADIAGNTRSTMTMVIDTAAPALPTVDLQTASDTGSKNDDNVTQSSASGLKLDVTAEPDTIVELYRDGLTVTAPSGPPAVMPCPGATPASAPVTCPAGAVVNPGGALTMTGFNDTNAATLSAWHGYVAQVTDKAGNVSAGNLPVYIDADAPVAPAQLDLISDDDHGASSDDNVTNVARPRFNVTGAEDGAVVELTACEGPGCTLTLSLAPFLQRQTRTVVIGSRIGNGLIQADADWWKKTTIGILDNYTAGGGPVFPGNAANTSWRFSVRQRDLAGRQGATFSQDLSVVIDTTPLPTPSAPDLVVASDTGPSDSDNVTAAVSPRFNIASGQGRVELLRDGQVVAIRTAAGDITDPGPLGNGAYTYTTRATDTAGNVSAASAPLTVVIEHTAGYWLVGSDGGVFAMGNAPFFGSLGGMHLNAPVIAVVPTPSHNGYWLLASDGGVFAFGDAGFFGSTGDVVLNSPIVGMVSTPTGQGYWLFAKDGGVFSFGDAGFYGSPASSSPTSPIVAMRSAPDGLGYWLVSAAGKVYAFGSASSLAGVDGGSLNSPIVGMAVTPTGRGLWLAGADGGIFTLGDAGFFGSMGGERVNSPVIGLEATPTGDGYWELAGDGGVFAFGGAPFLGSTGGMRLNRPIVGMGLS